MRYPLKTQWEEASERTRRRHLRKAKEAVVAVLEEVAPNQCQQLWQSLVASKSLESHLSSDNDDDIDEVFMEALAECYRNADNWQTRLVQGRGVPLPLQSSRTRLAVSQTQLDHFLDFITSQHVIQDLPFGQKSITLSTKEVITVPNVVRMMIPESIVKQYLSYAEECGFTPLSRRTLLRILSVCSASTRKSLQGLDYVSSAGSQAFDDLSHVVDRLGDTLMGMTWAREQKQRLKAAKRYLKSDFKVTR